MRYVYVHGLDGLRPFEGAKRGKVIDYTRCFVMKSKEEIEDYIRTIFQEFSNNENIFLALSFGGLLLLYYCLRNDYNFGLSLLISVPFYLPNVEIERVEEDNVVFYKAGNNKYSFAFVLFMKKVEQFILKEIKNCNKSIFSDKFLYVYNIQDKIIGTERVKKTVELIQKHKGRVIVFNERNFHSFMLLNA